MPNLSKDWLATMPSVTRFLFLSTLSITILLTVFHHPATPYFLPDGLLALLRRSFSPLGAPPVPLSLSDPSSLPSALYRALTSFLVYPLFASPTWPLACLSFITLATYSRHVEEDRLPNPVGAARYTSALLFAALSLAALSLTDPPALYFSSALSLLFFVVTLDTTFAPYEALSFSSVLQQWHSPYLLLLLFCALFPPALWPLALGIGLAYAHHVVTEGMGRVWGVRLWGTPDVLVRLYERWGIGMRKFGFQTRPGLQLGGETPPVEH